MPSQRERVLRALQQGPLVSTDFLHPTDGGKPVIRVAARVQELRDEGFEITTTRLENGVARYVLVAEVQPPTPPSFMVPERSSGALFDPDGWGGYDKEAA